MNKVKVPPLDRAADLEMKGGRKRPPPDKDVIALLCFEWV